MLAGLVVDWTCVSVSWWSAFVIRGWHGYVSCSPHCGIYTNDTIHGYSKGFSCFVYGTEHRQPRDDKAIVKMKPLSSPVDSFTNRWIAPSRPAPPRKYLWLQFTGPSRRQNLPLPSRPAIAVTPSRQDIVNNTTFSSARQICRETAGVTGGRLVLCTELLS